MTVLRAKSAVPSSNLGTEALSESKIVERSLASITKGIRSSISIVTALNKDFACDLIADGIYPSYLTPWDGVPCVWRRPAGMADQSAYWKTSTRVAVPELVIRLLRPTFEQSTFHSL
jgi:hypothetical protein